MDTESLELESLEIVPPEFFALLYPAEARSLDKPAAARILDDYLRRLARLEARCRVLLGRVAGRFVAQKLYHRLGFVRLGNYSRERLGLCEREMRDLVTVADGLESLPLLAQAFTEGSINWTKLRAVAGVATAETEKEWLELAGRHTAEELRWLIKDARAEAGVAADGSDDDSDDEGVIDGEPKVRFRLRCPLHVVALWRRARELAKRMAGSELSQWQCAEVIAGEGLSGAPLQAAQHEHEKDPSAQAAARWRTRVMNQLSRPLGESPEPAGPGSRIAADFDIEALRETLDWSPQAQTLPDHVAGLAAGIEDLDAHGLDDRMRALVFSMQQIDWQIGRLLRILFGPSLHRELGYWTTAAYVRERLGFSTSKARALVALDRKSSWVSPELTESYRRGEISWYRALVLLPVIKEDNAEAWLEEARSVTARRLQDAVELARARSEGHALRPSLLPPSDAELAAARPASHRGLDEILSKVQIGADGGSHGELPLTGVIEFYGPASVVDVFQEAITVHAEGFESVWRSFERLLVHVIREWEGRPRHRDPVHERDGWRCSVPGCSSRRNLNDHHVIFKSHHYDNSLENRVSVCVVHHQHGLHKNTIRARGRVGQGIVWELGVRRGGEPLLRSRRERYVGRADRGTECGVWLVRSRSAAGTPAWAS